jgi:hypothetical protein
MKDVASGFVTLDSAKKDYGVIIDPDTKSIDQDASKS